MHVPTALGHVWDRDICEVQSERVPARSDEHGSINVHTTHPTPTSSHVTRHT